MCRDSMDVTRLALSLQLFSHLQLQICDLSDSGGDGMLAHPAGLGSGGGSVRWQTGG